MMKTQIESALLTAISNAQGSVVTAPRGVLQIMKDMDLIGSNHGLTRQGSIMRERVMNAQLDKAFG